jgi:chromosome segregation ATPase
MNTENLGSKRPFEERVFARFDAVDARLNEFEARFDNVDARFDAVDSRLQKLEIRAYDTKPIWEQALREIVDTRRELSKRLDRIEAVIYETRSDLRDVEDRIDKLERKPPVQ